MAINLDARAQFLVKKLSQQDIENMVQTNVLRKPYIFDPQRLRIANISYYDFDGKSHNGQMVLLDAVADNVVNIFEELYRQKFPIDKMKLMNFYNGDDDLSMKDNNSSAFNQRNIAGQQQLSIHAYGLAIDVNPIQNPFVTFNYVVGVAQYSPIAGTKFANRLENRPQKPISFGLVEKIKNIFYQNGFNIWGGNWDNPIDYQHFQTSRNLAELLVAMDASYAAEFFQLHIQFLKHHQEELADYMKNYIGKDLVLAYKADNKGFMDLARKIVPNSISKK